MITLFLQTPVGIPIAWLILLCCFLLKTLQERLKKHSETVLERRSPHIVSYEKALNGNKGEGAMYNLFTQSPIGFQLF